MVRARARCLSVIGVALLLLAATGCGAVSATGSTQAADWQTVTACIRSHGMPDWPDPAVGPDGQLGFPADAPHTTDQVQRACTAQFGALSVRDTATAVPPSSADLALLLRFAQCLRSHGYPSWPDPGQDGTFPYAAIKMLPNVKQVLTHPPLVCRSTIPSGGIRVAT